MYFLYESNPAYTNPESGLTSEVLKNEKLIPYLVVADSYMTETASLADLVLPVATYLESWGLDSSPALDLVPFVALQQPIIRPYANSVPYLGYFDRTCPSDQVEGLQRYFKFNSTEEYIKKVISGIQIGQGRGLEIFKRGWGLVRF